MLCFYSGRKVFLLVPPNKGNLLMFEEWSSSERQVQLLSFSIKTLCSVLHNFSCCRQVFHLLNGQWIVKKWNFVLEIHFLCELSFFKYFLTFKLEHKKIIFLYWSCSSRCILEVSGAISCSTEFLWVKDSECHIPRAATLGKIVLLWRVELRQPKFEIEMGSVRGERWEMGQKLMKIRGWRMGKMFFLTLMKNGAKRLNKIFVSRLKPRLFWNVERPYSGTCTQDYMWVSLSSWEINSCTYICWLLPRSRHIQGQDNNGVKERENESFNS